MKMSYQKKIILLTVVTVLIASTVSAGLFLVITNAFDTSTAMAAKDNTAGGGSNEADYDTPEIPLPSPVVIPSPTPTPVYSAKLVFTGDLMVHSDQMTNAYNSETDSYEFDYSLSKVKPYLENADATIGNLETVFGGADIGYSDYPMFNTPDSFGDALYRAGFDMLSTANNHSLDKKEAGLLRTLDVLDGLGFGHFGTYRSQEERDNIFITDINGITFAFLSYTYGTNGLPIPEGKEYIINLLSEELIAADIASAKALNPDIIVVMPHMGNEYELEPREIFVDQINHMLDAGANIVVASHPHVVQPMGFKEAPESSPDTRRRFVAYSMGNFISSQRTLPREAGLMLNIYVEKEGDGPAEITAASFTPTWVKYTSPAGGRDMIVLPVVETLRAYNNGEDVNLRPQDINRIKDVHKELSETVLGYDITLEYMQDEYFIDSFI